MKVFDAAVDLAALGIGALAVVDGEKLVGIITDRDILLCLADTGSDFFRQTVQDWMMEKPKTCTIMTGLVDALDHMDNHSVRHLVVVERGTPVAVVYREEILALTRSTGTNRLYEASAISGALIPNGGTGKRKP